MSTWSVRIFRGRRLDRNPLRRPSDRAETLTCIWLLVIFAVLTPLAARIAAAQTQRVAEHARVAALDTRRQVTATTLQAAALDSGSPYITTVWVNAAWTAPDGRVRTGQIQVSTGTAKGAPTRIWVTGSGDVVSAPLRAGQIPRLADLAATVTVLVLIVVFASLGILIRFAFNRRRLAAWDDEWAAIEPRWNRQRW
jgi:hypothetical protein